MWTAEPQPTANARQVGEHVKDAAHRD